MCYIFFTHTSNLYPPISVALQSVHLSAIFLYYKSLQHIYLLIKTFEIDHIQFFFLYCCMSHSYFHSSCLSAGSNPQSYFMFIMLNYNPSISLACIYKLTPPHLSLHFIVNIDHGNWLFYFIFIILGLQILHFPLSFWG